jgi:hypothetical protein
MAKLIIKPDPIYSKKIQRQTDKKFLTEALIECYPNGFSSETKIFMNSPSEENEIDLKNMGADIPIDENSIVWVCHFPKGFFLITGAIAAAGYFGYKKLQQLQQESIQAAIDQARKNLQRQIESEISSETNIESMTAKVGTSSNNLLQGQANVIRLNQKVPQIYGHLRAFPDLIGDAYNEFNADLASGNIGDQTMYQYFCISEGLILSNIQISSSPDVYIPHAPRLGNQFLTGFSFTDDPDKENSLVVRRKTEQFLYRDYINHLKNSETKELWPRWMSGNFLEVTALGDQLLTSDFTNSRVTLEQFFEGDGTLGDVQSYGLYLAIVNGIFESGDVIEVYSNSGNVLGTFGLKDIYMEPGDFLRCTVVMEIENPTGTFFTADSSYQFKRSTDSLFFYNATNLLRGQHIRTGDLPNPNVPTHISAGGSITLSLDKRPQNSAFDEFAIANITFPEGMDLTVGNNPNKIISEFRCTLLEIDENGSAIGLITTPVVRFAKIGKSPVTITLKIPAPSVDGRRIAITVSRIDGDYASMSPYSDYELSEKKQKPIGSKLKSTIVEVGYLTERTNFSSDNVTFLEFIRRNNRGDTKPPTGVFNAVFGRVLDEYFDFSTKQWVLNDVDFNLTKSWEQSFMWHANKVGNIPIEDIDTDALDQINTDVVSESGGPVQFNFTFSNKNSSLDEELALICSSVRVVLYKEGSVYKFSRDQPKVKVGHITSRNVSLDGNSKIVNFSLPNTNDGIELEYMNDVTYKTEIIYIPDDRSAKNPKRMFLSGITDYTLAWRRANYEYLKLYSQRVTRSVLTTKEGMLWDILDRITVYDHTKLSITKPLSESANFFRQETEIISFNNGVFTGSEKLIKDPESAMAMGVNLDFPGGIGVVEFIPITIDPIDTNKFSIDDGFFLKSTIEAQVRTIGGTELRQIGERVFIYPFSVSSLPNFNNDDYLILSKTPEGEMVRLELVRYDENLYQFDTQNP